MNKITAPYHHGDLRNTAIIAAAELIDQLGNYEISITNVAKRAGVSSAALYRHFEDKEALLTAVRELALIGLMKRLEVVAAQHQQGTQLLIEELGICYLQFAKDKRSFFGLLWEDRGNMEQRRLEAQAKRTGFEVLIKAAESYLYTHSPESDISPVRLATQLWSIAHGIATLEHNRMLDIFDETINADQLLRDGTQAFLKNTLDSSS